MELFSAILGDLVSRSLSFMIDRHRKELSVDDSIQRLHQLLLRIRTIVEEAEGREVTNQGMIRQLKVLREEMFRGYCVLDAFRYQALGGESRDEQEVSHSFGLSRFNQAKRIRFSSSRSNMPPSRVVSMKDLQKMVSGLEDIIGDTKEFLVFLMSYPPMYRQPYSMHLYLDKCMFSRHMEREHVIAFLLSSRDNLCAESVEVLPIVGPPQVGKSTLVENFCNDERVRNHFSLILYYSAENLDDEKASSFSETCVTKHQNDAVDGRLLVIMELVGDVDDEAWKKLRSSADRRIAHGRSKIIITSQSEEITRLGTVQALRLEQLQFEAFWYFFKVLVFGSTNPVEHPRLASMAMEIATELRGCFMCAHISSALLRANFTAQFWRRLLAFSREYKKYPFASSDCQDGTSTKDHPRHGWEIAKSKPAKYFLLRNSYQKALVQDDGPKITLADLLFGSVKRRGRFEVLVWKSHIPPYYSYISNCIV